MLAALGAEAAARPALVTAAGEVSFAELARAVDAASRAAAAAPRELALLTARAEPAFVVDVLAHLRAGRPAAILPGDATEKETAERLAALGARRLGSDLPDGTALVLFTSGSSGKPKGVALSAAAIAANTRAVIASLGMAEVRSQALFLPLAYSFGLLGQLLPALSIGVTTHLYPDIVAAREAFEGAAVPEMWSGVPSHLATLRQLLADDEDLAAKARVAIRRVVSAGAALDREQRRQLRAAFPAATIHACYGQTEAAPRILSLASTDTAFDGDATGYAVDGWELALGGDGELRARGPQVMLGYTGDPAGTAAKVEAGWLCTGDVAEMSASGLVTVLGRRDGLVKIDGERVSLLEVERALRGLSGVADACAVALPGGERGPALAAALVLDAGVASQDAALKEIKRGLRQAVSRAKIPGRMIVAAALPRLANGKVDRAAVTALLSVKGGPT
jgi:long-chain acyl-CoA synthetase